MRCRPKNSNYWWGAPQIALNGEQGVTLQVDETSIVPLLADANTPMPEIGFEHVRPICLFI